MVQYATGGRDSGELESVETGNSPTVARRPLAVIAQVRRPRASDFSQGLTLNCSLVPTPAAALPAAASPTMAMAASAAPPSPYPPSSSSSWVYGKIQVLTDSETVLGYVSQERTGGGKFPVHTVDDVTRAARVRYMPYNDTHSVFIGVSCLRPFSPLLLIAKVLDKRPFSLVEACFARRQI